MAYKRRPANEYQGVGELQGHDEYARQPKQTAGDAYENAKQTPANPEMRMRRAEPMPTPKGEPVDEIKSEIQAYPSSRPRRVKP